MELVKKQKRLYGEVVISIEGRPRPITLIEVMNPMKLIEAYKKISSYNGDTDCIKIF